jgi:hypothetical protein
MKEGEEMKANSYPREVETVFKNKGELEIKLMEVEDLLYKKKSIF